MITNQVTDLFYIYSHSCTYLNYNYDSIFVIKSLKNPTASFNIYNFIQFHSSPSRVSHANKLIHHRSSNLAIHHFFFNRVPSLWNVLPINDILLPTSTLISRLKTYFWQHLKNFDSTNLCTFHLLCPFSKCSSI